MATDMIVLLLLLYSNVVDLNELKSRIVGGKPAKIEEYPFSVFISVFSDIASNRQASSWTCSGSVVNHRIIMTAGHCVAGCNPQSDMIVQVGNRKMMLGSMYLIKNFELHEYYDEETMANDISVLQVNGNLKLGAKVSRVILLPHTRLDEYASLAGWGLVNEYPEGITNTLIHVRKLKVSSRSHCGIQLDYIPPGTICTGKTLEKGYAAQGDSGSALVIRDNIQIGLVSFKIPEHSLSKVVYTETAYFHKWIRKHVNKMYCT